MQGIKDRINITDMTLSYFFLKKKKKKKKKIKLQESLNKK